MGWLSLNITGHSFHNNEWESLNINEINNIFLCCVWHNNLDHIVCQVSYFWTYLHWKGWKCTYYSTIDLFVKVAIMKVKYLHYGKSNPTNELQI